MAFTGYPAEALEFLTGLATHNEKVWFDPRKKVYEEAVKAPTVALIEALNEKLERFAPEYRVPDSTKAVPRLNRDVRFSKDKSPYKTEVGVVFPNAGGDKEAVAGFYVGVSAKAVTVLGGTYMPGPPQLAALREAMATRTSEFRSLIAAARLRSAMGDLRGERLKGVPRGYPKDHPAADLLGLTQAFFQTVLPPEIATSTQLVKEITKRFEAMTPFVRWLDDVLAKARAAGR